MPYFVAFLLQFHVALASPANLPPKAKITIIEGRKKTKGPNTIQLSGKNSSDPDKDRLQYFWDFANEYKFNGPNPPPYTFKTIGDHQVILTVQDEHSSKNSANLTLVVAPISSAKKTSSPNKSSPANSSLPIPNSLTPAPDSLLLFNELLPNPEGQDKNNEWIEIFNPNSTFLDLKNWKIIISSGSKPKIIYLPATNISAKEIFLISNKNSSFTLNNEKATLQLFNPDNNLSDEISYEKSPSGQSYAKINFPKNNIFSLKQKWEWSGNSTPGAINPPYLNLSGIIQELSTDFFILKTADRDYSIFFTNFPPSLAKITFPTGSAIEVLAEQINNEKYLLKDFQIEKASIATNHNHSILKILAVLAIILIIVIIKVIPKNLKT